VIPLVKKYITHFTFISLMAGIAWQGKIATVTDRSSLLYNIIAGEEITEGPLDPSAYAGTDAPGIGGARLAALDANLAVNMITFSDPEVNFASALSGNAVVAPLNPLVPEPGTQETTTRASHKPIIYTVTEGDTVASIAAQFNISTNTVLWANGLSSRDVIQVGDHITILPTTGVLHTVKSGDTVSGLSKAYDADAADIISYNNLGDDARLAIGQKVIIPDGALSTRVTAPSISSPGSRVADGPTPPPTEAKSAGLIWPTTTRHVSQYFRWGHTGVDIDNRSRPPVYAAASGTVEFAGRLGGYGNLIIINHGNGLSTYYAHLDNFYISKGQSISQGAAIGKMGSTGRSTGPHLHFEVRKHGRPINPLSMY
jgi:LysM repeat protein